MSLIRDDDHPLFVLGLLLGALLSLGVYVWLTLCA